MIDVRIEIALKRELLQWFASSRPSDGIQRAGTNDVILSTAKNGREENEDRAIYAQFTSPQEERCFSLLAVLDGIGGMIDGGRCAEIAIVSILTNLISLPRSKNRITLVEALAIANHDVWHEYNERGGATFAGVFFERGLARSVNIGDSRVYTYHPSKGLVLQSSDDRLGNQFAKVKGLEGVGLNPELASRLGQYLGMSGKPQPNIRVIDEAIFRTPHSLLLVSTDGAHAVGNEFISETLRKYSDLTAVVAALIKRSSRYNDADNATVVCARGLSIVPVGEERHSPFEQLRIWSINNCFSLIISGSGVASLPVPRKSRTHGRKRTPIKPSPAKRAASKKQVPSSAATKVPDRDKASKSQVTIQQLNFEPASDDDASE